MNLNNICGNMKKTIFMVSLAMMAMVSCVNDDVVQINKGQKIEFRTALDTRVAELTIADFDKFQLTALYDNNSELYFSDYFIKGSGTTVYASETEHYWPANEDLKFFAYAPVDLSGVSIDKREQLVKNFTPNTDVSNQVDFVTCFTVAGKDDASDGVVSLEFKHQLSQIGVVAFNSNSGYKIQVKAVRIKNVYPTGDFYFASGGKDWDVNEDEELVSYEISCLNEEEDPLLLDESNQSLMFSTGNAMLIPQTRLAWGPKDEEDETEIVSEGAEGEGDGELNGSVPETPQTAEDGSYIAFQIKVTTATGSLIYPMETDDEDGFGWVAIPFAFNWAPGYKYTYECDFSNGVGVVAPDELEVTPGSSYNPGEIVYGSTITITPSVSSIGTTYTNEVDM